MMSLVARLLAAASVEDPIVREECAGFPEGLVIGMSVLGDTPKMRLRVIDGRLVATPGSDPVKPDLEVVFKHVSHAFLVLAFQEGTARAFANDRMITHGDLALAMRLVRCLNRMEAIALPRIVAERALKQYPELPVGTKLGLAARTYGRLVSQVLSRSGQ